MLEQISEKFVDLFKTISGKSSITEKNIEDSVEQIKIALLEADVHLRVVRRFINSVLEEAKGDRVLRSVSPGQQFTKIVYDKMVSLLSQGDKDLQLKGPDTQSVILLLGLQGAGKTTTAAKLALHLKQKGRKVLLVPCDLQRPAAVMQLTILGGQVGVDVFEPDANNNSALQNPLAKAKAALQEAKKKSYDVVIVDTAGRLQLDDLLMQELVSIRDALNPVESLLVADSMTGQIASEIARGFDEKIHISGGILTKFDSDARGGAALSFKSVTGKPIKFITTGEKPENLQAFLPERIASRILGMGDVVSLVEKAQAVVDKKEAAQLEKKIAKETLSLQDYLEQIQNVKKMGSIQDIVAMLPGMAGSDLQEDAIDETKIKKEESILLSMTKKERQNYLIIGPSRRSRISRGSGTSVAEVSRLLKKFEKTKLMLKKLSKNKKQQQQLFGNMQEG